MAVLQISSNQMSPLDALWTLFINQPKKVRKAFAKRVIEEETSDNLKDDVVKHIKSIREGKERTYSFNSLDEAKKWLDE